MGKNKRDIYFLAGLGMSLGLEVGIASTIGWWIGSQIDKKFQCSPAFSLIGVFVCFGATVFHMIKVYEKLNKNAEDNNNDS